MFIYFYFHCFTIRFVYTPKCPHQPQEDDLLYGIRSWAAQQLDLPTEYVEPLQILGVNKGPGWFKTWFTCSYSQLFDTLHPPMLGGALCEVWFLVILRITTRLIHTPFLWLVIQFCSELLAQKDRHPTLRIARYSRGQEYKRQLMGWQFGNVSFSAAADQQGCHALFVR